MNRKQRLLATLHGKTVDRPPVSFYELESVSQDPEDVSPYNIYSDPSWLPLFKLVREKTDLIARQVVPFRPDPFKMLDGITEEKRWEDGASLFVRTTIHTGARVLTQLTRRDKDTDTVWILEHLCKSPEDLDTYIRLPDLVERTQRLAICYGEARTEVDYSVERTRANRAKEPRSAAPSACAEPDISGVLATEESLSDSGIVYLDTADPLCCVACLFEFGEFTVLAMSQPALMHRALECFAQELYARTEAVAKALPGRLWRIYGPEYASPPYMRPSLYEDYVVRYDKAMVQTIQKYGGYARIHSHGRLKDVLDSIVGMGCDGLDPIEPPPQGDVELAHVRQNYGRQLVLFGNLEIADIENLPPDQFRQKVLTAMDQGTMGEGRGFVLMPSSCPCGRKLSSLTLKNYETMLECIERF